jgi:hypothetical protein
MENRRPADQLDHSATHGSGGGCAVAPTDHPALRLIAARPDIFIRQGHIAATRRRRNGKTFGPYYRLAYRDAGRQCSVYLGRAGVLVDMVRQALAHLQGHRIALRRFNTMARQIRAAMRIEKLNLASLLRPFGLRMKGFEVRGWRFSPRWRRRAVCRLRLSALRRLRCRAIKLCARKRSRMRNGTWAANTEPVQPSSVTQPMSKEAGLAVNASWY